MIVSKKKSNRGQSMVEYIALTALVAIVCIGGVKVLGGKVRTRLTQITKSFDRNISQGLKPSRDILDDDGDEEGSPNTSSESTASKAVDVAGSILKGLMKK